MEGGLTKLANGLAQYELLAGRRRSADKLITVHTLYKNTIGTEDLEEYIYNKGSITQ